MLGILIQIFGIMGIFQTLFNPFINPYQVPYQFLASLAVDILFIGIGRWIYNKGKIKNEQSNNKKSNKILFYGFIVLIIFIIIAVVLSSLYALGVFSAK